MATRSNALATAVGRLDTKQAVALKEFDFCLF
jgi:hypothetical protein